MRYKVAGHHAKATAKESARWSCWARRAGFSAVGAWLEALANREVRRLEEEGKPEKNPAAVALGRLGGKKGGKALAAKLSAERRREIAKKAAAARWGKTKKIP